MLFVSLLLILFYSQHCVADSSRKPVFEDEYKQLTNKIGQKCLDAPEAPQMVASLLEDHISSIPGVAKSIKKQDGLVSCLDAAIPHQSTLVDLLLGFCEANIDDDRILEKFRSDEYKETLLKVTEGAMASVCGGFKGPSDNDVNRVLNGYTKWQNFDDNELKESIFKLIIDEWRKKPKRITEQYCMEKLQSIDMKKVLEIRKRHPKIFKTKQDIMNVITGVGFKICSSKYWKSQEYLKYRKDPYAKNTLKLEL